MHGIFLNTTDLILLIVGFIAAFTDTIAGGGGLIALPALLFSGLPPITALGTNKFQTVVGELSSTIYFFKKKTVNYNIILPCFIFVIIGSIAGVLALQEINIKYLEKIIPILLTYVLVQLIFSFKKKNKANSLDLIEPNKNKFIVLGSSIGFYNGFFGPGTGSIWTIMLMKFFKINMRSAIMYTKPLNLLGNLSALIVFIAIGKIAYISAIVMAVGAFFGAKLGGYVVFYKNLFWIKVLFFLIIVISTVSTYFKYY